MWSIDINNTLQGPKFLKLTQCTWGLPYGQQHKQVIPTTYCNNAQGAHHQWQEPFSEQQLESQQLPKWLMKVCTAELSTTN